MTENNNVSVKCEEDPKSVKHYKFTAQKMKFSIKISPVNLTESAVFCGNS